MRVCAITHPLFITRVVWVHNEERRVATDRFMHYILVLSQQPLGTQNGRKHVKFHNQNVLCAEWHRLQKDSGEYRVEKASTDAIYTSHATSFHCLSTVF